MNPRKLISRFAKALKFSDRKRASKMVYEYLVYKFTKPELALQYFNKFLFRQSVTNPDDYIVTPEIEEQVWYYNDMNYKSILSQKHTSELFFSKFNIPVVRSFAFNDNHLFFNGNDHTLINSSRELKDFLISLKNKGIWHGESMIVKMKDGSYGGMNILKISFSDIRDNKSVLGSLYSQIIKSGYLFQDIIVQHPELNKVNPNSLNSIRIDTFTNKEGIPKIFNTTLRFSCSESYIDNISHGGMFTGINLETGQLHPEAFSNFDNDNREVLLSHPLTGLVFKDFQIPFFQQVKQLAIDAAKLLPLARVVGWDICITPDGPVLLEGNYYNGLYRFELGQNGLRKNHVFRELLIELNRYYNEEGNNLDELKKKYPLYV